MHRIWQKGLKYAVAFALGYQGARLISRQLIKNTGRGTLKTLMTDPYDENLWELVSATARSTPQIIVETNLRAEEGKAIQRPMGSYRKFPSLDQLMFNIGQLHVMPTPLEIPVDTKVMIGKRCKKPLIIDIPIMVSAMAYGKGLSEKAKVALAKGATMVGTAINSGEGPFLMAERKAASKFIFQYNRGNWSKEPAVLQQADAIEIQFGQGAIGGTGHRIDSSKFGPALRNSYKLLPGQDAIVHSRQPEINHPAELPKLVQKIKGIAGDIPIGAKIGAGKYLEKDLEWLAWANIDFVTVEGGEGATKGSPPILQDDFGVPSIFAINRAANYLRKHNLQDRISLIAAGKMRTPGDVLKALALGADAVYMGSMALFAVSHTQVLKAVPFEPPTQLVWYDGKYQKKFNVNEGAKSLAKFLTSCNEEIIEGIRALGKTSIKEVSKEDLFALDELTAKGIEVPLAYQEYSPDLR
ncbi:MAG: FMN-binding glutamate synthase family protein [Syntrophomonadaceae bacterium]|nr:FMN-binding glutamate synthase family protein [Syntrophomonadaceae bacterium]